MIVSTITFDNVMLQWYEVETLVCGSANVDIEALRKHTTYSSGMSASHPTVRFLFRALESYTEVPWGYLSFGPIEKYFCFL